jgi:plasmid stabilization system protein ParE
LVLEPYLALYRVEKGDAVILRILHGKQNVEAVDAD